MPSPQPRTSSRVEPLKEKLLSPFVRANAVEDASIYWLPVSQFPMLLPEREWLLEFQRRLALRLGNAPGLREECFLQFKSLYPDLLERFTATTGDYVPMTGLSLTPGTASPPLPDMDSIRKQVEEAQKSGNAIDVNRWMPDYLHWFLLKKAEAQRRDFFGFGGMLTLYLPPDPNTAAPVLEMPRIIKTHPGYSDTMQAEIAAAYSLRDSFLARSKQVFGTPFASDPSYKGMLFVLPLLTGASMVQAPSEERTAWFEVFDGYLIESRLDRGVLLMLKDPAFDDVLWELLEQMRNDGLHYLVS